MRTAILAGLLALLSACTSAPRAADTETSQGPAAKLPDVQEEGGAPAEFVPYQVKFVFGEPQRYGDGSETSTVAPTPPAKEAPPSPKRNVMNGLRKLLGGVTRIYQRASVGEGSSARTEMRLMTELWPKGKKHPWAAGETLQGNGWKLKLLATYPHEEDGTVFEIEVLSEGASGN